MRDGEEYFKEKEQKSEQNIASLENHTVVVTKVYISQGEKVMGLGRKHLNTFDLSL